MYQDDGRAGPKQFAAMRDGGAVIGFDIVAYLTGRFFFDELRHFKQNSIANIIFMI